MSNMVINTNVMALTSHRAMKNVGNTLSKTSERLSTGLRINRAADDAAGLAISEKMRSQIRGLDQASRNAQDGISLIQTAEGALQETHEMMQRMRELVVQASSDALEQSDRDKIALELDELSKEINATAEKTQFNKKQLIDGTWKDNKIYIQVGANALQGLEFNITGMSADSLGVNISQIGDIVRGKYSTLAGEVAGKPAIEGVYDDTAFNGLKVESSTRERLTPATVGTNGVMQVGTGTNDTITINANKTLTIGANITVTNTKDGTTETWAATDKKTIDDLVGKTIESSDGLRTWSFSKDDDGVISVETTTKTAAPTTIDTSGVTNVPSTFEVAGVKLTVNAGAKAGDNATITTAKALYNVDGDEIAAAKENLKASTKYYDDKGTLLFETGTAATTGMKVTEYTAGAERTIGAGPDALYVNSGVKLKLTGTKLEMDSSSAKLYTQPGTGATGGVPGTDLTEVGSAELVTGGKYYDGSGTLLFEVVDATAGKIKEYSGMDVTLSAPEMKTTTTVVSGVELDINANGKVTLKSGTIETASGAVSTGTALTANTNYYDNAGKLLFSTGDTAKDIITYEYNNAANIATTPGTTVGSINLTLDNTTEITPSTDIFVEGSTTAHTNGGALIDSKMYYDKNGSALFYSTATGSATGNIETIKSTTKMTLQTPAEFSLLNGGIKITSDGTNFKFGSSTVGTIKDDTGATLTADTALVAGKDYYNGTTGEKVFGVTTDGKLVEYAKPADTVTATKDLFTPKSRKSLEIDSSGIISVASNTNTDSFKTVSGKIIANGSNIEDLVGESIYDDQKDVTWTFTKGEDGKISVSDGTTTKVITETVPVASEPNKTLGTFVSGMDLGGFSIDADGMLGATTSEITSNDGRITLEGGYDFSTGTKHLGKTFDTPGATISFDLDGNISIEDKAPEKSGARLSAEDYAKLDDAAKTAYDKFNTDMKTVLADGGSHGKVISLLTDRMDAAIEIVSSQRAQLGAYQNRLEHTIKNLDISSENLSAAESRIRDADMAKEMMNMTKANVLQSAAIAMLAQANQAPQNILQLLR